MRDKHGICRYKLRAKVDIADVSSEYTTWARFGPGLMPEGEQLLLWAAKQPPACYCLLLRWAQNASATLLYMCFSV